MKVKVLVVDDSSFFRRRLTEILGQSPKIEVIGQAADGMEAIKEARRLRPDVITMDIEMPVLDGISAVRRIMAERRVPILMFSSLTHEGAQATLDALDAGAVDFLPKRFEDIARNRAEAIQVLQQRVLEIAKRPAPFISTRAPSRTTTSRLEPTGRVGSSAISRTPLSRAPSARHQPGLTGSRAISARAAPEPMTRAVKDVSQGDYKILAIGTSTGGPVALQTILTSLPADFPVPIVLIQHMPAAFTNAFAKRLDGLCKIHVKEAEDGDVLQPGYAYLAPGGKQMVLDGRPGSVKLRVREDDGEKLTYRPSVDLTFASVSRVYSGQVLAMVLTGMGADGRDGSRMLKERGATVWTQDEQSCVVYGMPQAVAKAGYSDQEFALPQIASAVLKAFGLDS